MPYTVFQQSDRFFVFLFMETHAHTHTYTHTRLAALCPGLLTSRRLVANYCIGVSAYRPLSAFRCKKLLASLNTTRNLSYAYFRLRTAHCSLHNFSLRCILYCIFHLTLLITVVSKCMHIYCRFYSINQSIKVFIVA